jgi:hypothetical protein
MKNILTAFCLLLMLNISAQVGIGTTDPDPSAILELESDSQGLLAPRMSTTDRLAIVSPADGLLVYDTDDDAFYFYKASSWEILESAVKRDNYKLIKSVADLADELTAGGGVEYLMDENTLYEINGVINLVAPINMNNSNITGRDTGEDSLRRATGDLFAGSSGGRVTGLVVTATAGSVFNLNGTGAEIFVLRNTFVANSATVGDISNFRIVYTDAVRYVNNTNGIVYTDINELLLITERWLDSNGGIYQTFVGDFDLITKQGGFSKVVAASAAIDITGITSISGGAGMRIVDFFGGGNYINGSSPYIGYDFTREWDINCPGIPVETDGVALANFYYNGNLTTGFVQTITNGTAAEVQGNGTFTANSLFRFVAGGGNNRLIYDGVKTRAFQVNASLSIRVTNAPNNFYAFIIAKNGVLVTESNAVAYIEDDNQIQNIALNCDISLDNGDYIEVFAQRLTGTGTDTLVVFSENLSVK